MKCLNCAKDFHYCPSCGFIPEAELDCCSERCVRERLQNLPDEDRAKVLAEMMVHENVRFVGVKEMILSDRAAVEKALFDYAWHECFEQR